LRPALRFASVEEFIRAGAAALALRDAVPSPVVEDGHQRGRARGPGRQTPPPRQERLAWRAEEVERVVGGVETKGGPSVNGVSEVGDL